MITNLHRNESIVGQIQRFKTDKIIQGISEMSYFLLTGPRNAQRPNVACL